MSSERDEPVVYIPDFVEEYFDVTKYSPFETKKVLAAKQWVTDGLMKEVADCFPSSASINQYNDNERDRDLFAEKAALLFPVGRIFASFKQLDQAAELFCNAWAVKKTHPGKYIGCHYGKSIHSHRSRLHDDETKRRKIEYCPKSSTECPFRINYHYVGYHRNSDECLPLIYYKVKITSANYVHTCQLKTDSHREARQRAGSHQPDLNGVSDIIELLRNRPSLSISDLRPFVEKYVPSYKSTNTQFMSNFRRRCMKFILTHDSSHSPTFQEVTDITSSRPMAANEMLIDDNVLNAHSLRHMLRQVMQEDGSYWDALRFLDMVKEKNPNMVYLVKFSKEKKPQAIMWMLPEMREDLVRFGDIMFLDAQKRDYNQPGWPYIGPCVKDNENHVRVVCECICIVESHEMYCWILKSMGKLEPRWDVSSLRIIFADQLITKSLLCNLNIDQTCILHGDPYHLKNKVFPELFGNQFNNISGFLNQMLDCETQEVWDSTYSAALGIIAHEPKRQSELYKIYQNPMYYSRWYLNDILGSFDCRGSTHAEQNHASIVCHLGSGGNFSIAEHLKLLIERQVRQSKIKSENEIRSRQLRRSFKSSKPGVKGENENQARKYLSSFAFKELFKVESKKNLQNRIDGSKYVIWSCSYDWDSRGECSSYAEIQIGQRCSCQKRRKWLIQCRHELCVDGKFDIEKYHIRWLNNCSYQQKIGQDGYSLANCNVHGTVEADDSMSCVSQPVPSSMDIVLCNSTDSNGVERIDKSEEETYQSVLLQCENLLRLIQRDKSKMLDFSENVATCVVRARKNLPIKVSFDTSNVDFNDDNQIIERGRLNVAPNAANMKRFKSRHEKRLACAIANKRSSNDDEYCISNTKTRTCSLCGGKGHKKNTCPKVMNWGGEQLISKESRSWFGNSLLRNDIFRVTTIFGGYSKTIANELPLRMKGIVLHGLYCNGMCRFVECTLLMEGLESHPIYQLYPFSVNCIKDHLIRCGMTHVIISLLEKTATSSTVSNNSVSNFWNEGMLGNSFLQLSYNSSNGCV